MSGKIDLTELSRNDLLALWPTGFLKDCVSAASHREVYMATQIVKDYTARVAQEKLALLFPRFGVPGLTTIKRNRRHIMVALGAMEGRGDDLDDEPIPYDLVHSDAEIDVQIDAEVGDDTLAMIEAAGLDPNEWEVKTIRNSEWETHDGEKREARRVTFNRLPPEIAPHTVDLEDLAAIVDGVDIPKDRSDGTLAMAFFLGDMQFGKFENGTYEENVERVIAAINRAAANVAAKIALGYHVGHIHVGWLGDHIEGFVSQGGSNVWRTSLTLSDQLRITRYVMTHALTQFAPLANRLTMAAVPGNHGESQRIAGKGQTRYDDNHDTECLVAVSEAAALAGEKYEHVTFHVPETDEMTVLLEVGDLPILHAHGHGHRPNKHFEWWRGQAFHSEDAARARLLVEGHLHHDHIERDGDRLWIGVGALEKDSAWYRHFTGSTGYPGATMLTIGEGEVKALEFISAR